MDRAQDHARGSMIAAAPAPTRKRSALILQHGAVS
jgi:hypothetical protein